MKQNASTLNAGCRCVKKPAKIVPPATMELNSREQQRLHRTAAHRGHAAILKVAASLNIFKKQIKLAA